MSVKSKRPRPPKTIEETVQGLERQIQGLALRAAAEDPWVFAEMIRLRDELDRLSLEVLAQLRAPVDGRRPYTWNDIGFEFGLTASHAHKRWAHRVRRPQS